MLSRDQGHRGQRPWRTMNQNKRANNGPKKKETQMRYSCELTPILRRGGIYPRFVHNMAVV